MDSLHFLILQKEFNFYFELWINFILNMLTDAKIVEICHNQCKLDRSNEFISTHISATCCQHNPKRVLWKARCITYQLNADKTELPSFVL